MDKRRLFVLPLLVAFAGCQQGPEDAAAIAERLKKSGLVNHRTKSLKVTKVNGWSYVFELDQQTNTPTTTVRFEVWHDLGPDKSDQINIIVYHYETHAQDIWKSTTPDTKLVIHRTYMNGEQYSQFTYHDRAIADLSEEIHRIAKCISKKVH